MRPALSVLEADLVGYRRTWRASALSSFLLPILFVLGFGFSVGRFVDAGGQLGAVRYLDYIVPGMLASTAAQLAFGGSAWPVMSRFQWMRTYHAMIASPLRVVDIVLGDLMFLLLRVVAASAVALAVTAAFGAVHSAWAVAVPAVCALLGLAVAAPMSAFAARVEGDGYFTLLQRVVVLPMSLFSGVFFPIDGLAAGLRWLAYVSPLWHAVRLCRAATLPGSGPAWPALLGHLAYLAAWSAAGLWLAIRFYRRRLAS